jgi:hypothetical protein
MPRAQNRVSFTEIRILLIPGFYAMKIEEFFKTRQKIKKIFKNEGILHIDSVRRKNVWLFKEKV